LKAVLPMMRSVNVERARHLLPLCLLLVLGVTAMASAQPKRTAAATAPVVVAAGTGEVADTRATIGIALAPRDSQTRAYAEYGTTDAYGMRTPEARIPAGDEVVAVYRKLNRLEPSTTYHVRWLVANDGGEIIGPDQTFTTSGEGQAGDVGEVLQGLFISIAAASGKVKVRPAGRHRFRDVAGASERLALGSVIDVRHGKARITSALPDGTTQTATFHGGRFEVRQTSVDGRVDVHLRGGKFRRCRTGARASAGPPRAATSRKRRRKRRIRRLWGEDSSGLYSTYGLNSVATVRGTRWLTVDRCDGTLTRVVEGAVEVRNRRTGRTTVVEAGESHLVRRVR
jgi:hypothetical protein